MNKELDSITEFYGYKTVRPASIRTLLLGIECDLMLMGVVTLGLCLAVVVLPVVAAIGWGMLIPSLLVGAIPVGLTIAWIAARLPIFRTEWFVDTGFTSLIDNWNSLSLENREWVWPVYEELLPLLRHDTSSVREAYEKTLETTKSMIRMQERKKASSIDDKLAGPLSKISVLQSFIVEEQKLLDKYGV